MHAGKREALRKHRKSFFQKLKLQMHSQYSKCFLKEV